MSLSQGRATQCLPCLILRKCSLELRDVGVRYAQLGERQSQACDVARDDDINSLVDLTAADGHRADGRHHVGGEDLVDPMRGDPRLTGGRGFARFGIFLPDLECERQNPITDRVKDARNHVGR